MHLAKIALNELREPVRVARAIIPDEGIDELAASISRVGLINPITVREVDGAYEVVAGHRRLLACRRAGLVAVPCLVRGARDANPTALKIHENLYRQELSPVEEAAFYAELLPDCNNDTDRLAALVKQNRTYVEGRLNLLRGDPAVLEAVAQQEIALGVAVELNKMRSEADRTYYLHWARTMGATVSEVRRWRAIVDARESISPVSVPTGEAPTATTALDFRPPTCVACGEFEPAYDVEFRYYHHGCRRRLEAALVKLGLEPGASLVIQLEMLAIEVQKRERENANARA
jgi:ParB family chromosome partitioning protein